MFLCMLALCALAFASQTDDGGFVPLEFTVEHSFDGTTFTKRGVISRKSATSLHGQLDTELSKDHINHLFTSGTTGEDYYVRVYPRSDTGTTYAQAFVSAAAYYNSGLHDTLVIHLDSQGNVQSVDISLTEYHNAVPAARKKITHQKTSVVFVRHNSGVSPFVEKERQAMLQAANEDSAPPQSFLAKYWMYILPLAIMFLFNGGGQPEAERRPRS
eukprot:m.250203 g.250203  ORF g.250203 m.250203 type:complete len:215 (-) comp54505_c0_seq5:80-724(-)